MHGLPGIYLLLLAGSVGQSLTCIPLSSALKQESNRNLSYTVVYPTATS